MSGMRGAARKGKMKVVVTLKFEDTNKRVRTHLFVKESVLIIDILDRMTAKFDKDIYIESVRRKGAFTPMFQRAAA